MDQYVVVPLNSRDFRIMDISGDSTPACAQFQYKGFLVSISTLMSNTLVCVFQGDKFTDVLKDGFSSVRAAIDFIDAFVFIRDMPWDVRNAIISKLISQGVITHDDIL